MNVLITGGTGFIGQALIKAMRTKYDDINIVIISRIPEKFSHMVNENISLEKHLSAALIDKQDIVINLAGEPIAEKRWSDKQKNRICKSRWDITQAISALIVQSDSPPSLYVSGSAIGFYGRQEKPVIDESYPYVYEEFSHDICAKWENLALQASSSDTRVCLLRTGIVLGNEHGALGKMLLPFKMGLGGYFANGKQMMSWIHINDMVNAIIHVIEVPFIEGPINMAAPNAVDNRTFSKTLAQTLSRPCLFKTPAFALKILFGEMADLLIYGQNVKPKKLIDSGYVFQYPQLKKALTDLLVI
jgi:uncharacterized protein (TIGR01777 family)